MHAYLFVLYGFLLPLLSSAILCRVMRRKLGWLKSKERKPGKEKIHRLFPRPRRPLSGGLAILLAFTIGLMALNWPPTPLLFLYLSLVWLFGLIGLFDDLGKVGGRGLTEREKLTCQLIAGVLFAGMLYSGLTGIRFGWVHLPFADTQVYLGAFYPLWGMLVIVAASNAVNITDGIDGLAGGQTVIAAFFMLALCGFLKMPLAASIFLALMGACLGFLIFNYPPARLLMGDMGSLSLGAALGGGALLMGAEAYLPLVGAVFVINTLSVICQISTVRWLWRLVRFPRHKTTEAFRPFLCTPLHHHFQWLGWSEKAILRLFWGMGLIFGGLAVLSFLWSGVWLIGMLLLLVPLLLAALQKLLRGSYFVGVVSDDTPSTLGLFQGMPVEVLWAKLYRLVRRTSLTEAMLGPGAAEGLLWRPMTEIEARVALGSLFLQQHLNDEALAEWEQIPVRNLLLRESVVMQLARIYYSQDRLLEAMRLWEALPKERVSSMPNLQEVIRSAGLRLAELASKSYRQCMHSFTRAQAGEAANLAELSRQLMLSLRFNRDLRELLSSASDNVLSPLQKDAKSYQRVEKVLQERIQALEGALDWCEQRTGATPPEPTGPPTVQAAGPIRDWLGFEAREIEQALGESRNAKAELVAFQPSAKSSRNAITRLRVRWIPEGAGGERLVAKSYLEGRVTFFSACYRRERALLEMLFSYGCPVPQPYGGLTKADRALLLMESGGTETLAERLEGLDAPSRERLLAAAVPSLATLHRQASLHLSDLTNEVRKIDKETLTPQYHLSAFKIALERLGGTPRTPAAAVQQDEALRQYQPVARTLIGRPETFIHFEFTPQHLLLDKEQLTIFDFEQATVGPAEFDLVCLLYAPEVDLSDEAIDALVRLYEERSGLRLDRRALDYASLAKCLTYAGAALNFHRKFGGDYHLQRLDWYLHHCQEVLCRHNPLLPLRRLLEPQLDAVLARKSEAFAVQSTAPNP